MFKGDGSNSTKEAIRRKINKFSIVIGWELILNKTIFRNPKPGIVITPRNQRTIRTTKTACNILS
jgi:hypothetical protein